MGVGREEVLSWFDAVHWHQGEWVPEIVVALWSARKRFLDLLEEIRESTTQHRWSTRTRPLSRQSLAQTLQGMVRDELVLRHEDNSSAPKAVWYELTPVVRAFLEGQAGSTAEWVDANRDLIERVRQRRFMPNRGWDSSD